MDKAKATLDLNKVFGAKTLLQVNDSISELRANSLLREDEWKRVDDTVLDVVRSKDRTAVWNDLMERGLTDTGYDMGITLVQYETVSDMGSAETSMSGLAEGENQTVDFDIAGVPMPVFFKDFSLHLRRLRASRLNDIPLDTRQVRSATEKVKEALEDAIVNGNSITVAGNQIYGFTNHTDRASHSGSTWGTAGNIMDDIMSAIQTLDPYYKGPFTLYTNSAQYWEMMEPDPDGTGDMTVMERVMNKVEIEAVKSTDALADGNAILAQLNPNVVELKIAEDIQAIDWEGQGGFLQNTKVYGIMAPILYSDDNGRTGWCHIDSI